MEISYWKESILGVISLGQTCKHSENKLLYNNIRFFCLLFSGVPSNLVDIPSNELKQEDFITKLKEETGTSVLYQPFVIVGRLLEEGRHPCTQQQQQQRKTPSSCTKLRKRSYFQAEKDDEILHVDDSKKSKYAIINKKNSLVDCLVADLVSIFILNNLTNLTARYYQNTWYEYTKISCKNICAEKFPSYSLTLEEPLQRGKAPPSPGYPGYVFTQPFCHRQDVIQGQFF